MGTYCTFLAERWTLAANVPQVKCRKGQGSSWSEQNCSYPLSLPWSLPKVTWVLLNPDSGSTCPETFCRDERGIGFSLCSLFFSQFYLEFCTHPCSQMCQHKASGFKVCHCWLRFELSPGKMFITNVLLLHLFLSHSICLYFIYLFILLVSLWWHFQEREVINVYVKGAMFN